MQSSPTKQRIFGSTTAALGMYCLLMAAGCGYIVGSPYRQDVRTVYVPVFKNDTFRRGFELQLTEAVQKQIQTQTSYRLAKPGFSDAELTGRIVSIDKRVENQTKYDDPRELELSIAVEVRWTDMRTGQVLSERRIPIDMQSAHVISQSSFAPETGQSLATATQDLNDQLARQIVGLMEVPW